ncbi:MAG: hypothetical protein JO254_10290 [Pseudolabrys sp.]|nr:hypothetical protein [Pseudolabrys sp.]
MSFQDQPNFRDPNQQELPYADAAQRDNRLQPDPELGEGPAGAGRIAMTLVAGAFLVAIVLYGLNTQRNETAQESPAAATAAQNAAGPTETQPAQQDASTKSAPANTQPSTTGQGSDKGDSADSKAGANQGNNAAPAQNTTPPANAAKPQAQ